jgi:cytochrome c oxidase subunit I
MPPRYYNYIDQFQPLHAFSTVGSWIIGLGFIVMLVYLLSSLKSGEKAPRNPWGGISLEWETQSPPIPENFHETPEMTHGPYDFQAWQKARLADKERREREDSK